MKTKALAILAVLAMVFAGTAVLAEENDAGELAATIEVTDSLGVGRTALVTLTLTTPVANTEIVWESSATATLTIAGTDDTTEDQTTTHRSITNAQGKAYATITGVAAGSATITATVGQDSKTSDAITVSALATQQISTWGKDATKAMYAFAYTDAAILIDTKYMTNMTGVDDVVVSIQKAGAAETIIGPISAHERIWIDGTAHLEDTKKTTIILKPYGVDTELGKVEITPADVDAAASILNIDSNRIDLEDPLDADSYGNLVRNEVFDLSKPASASLMCDTYTLTGFAATEDNKTEKNLDGTITEGTDDIPLESFKIEDLLMLASQKGADQDTTTSAITIYANWAKTYYTITFKDATAAQIGEVSGSAGVMIDGSAVSGYVAVISGSTVIGSDSGSYGIISIAKKAANAGTQYTYQFFVTKADQETDISAANYKIAMVNNGTWKITDVKENLWISAIAIPTTALETGADFEVNYLKNDNTTEARTSDAEARIALDLEDYPATAGMELSMKGTYFKLIDTNVRAYGNIENLTVMTSYSDDTNIRQYTGYTDKVAAPALTEDNFNADTIHKGVLTTTDAGHEYDLVLKTKKGSNIMLYSIQGVWDTDGAAVTTGPIYTTPWALYEVA